MADPIEAGLLASVKALDDVVAKAVDPGNPLAREQLKLVSRYLGFLRQRLPWHHERERFELRHALALARQLREIAGADAPSLLGEAIAGGERVSRADDATPEQLTAAIRALNTATSVLVRGLDDYPPDTRRRMERAIVTASRRLFDVQRAWYLPMGFEPDPKAVAPLQQALAWKEN